MSRIFLSYGPDENEELVRFIKGDLERRRHDVWFDNCKFNVGEHLTLAAIGNTNIPFTPYTACDYEIPSRH